MNVQLPVVLFDGHMSNYVKSYQCRVSLLCFHIVEWYLPDRVFRQFGLYQGIPETCDTYRHESGRHADMHRLDGRGRSHHDWTREHAHYISLWDARRQYVVMSVQMDPYTFDATYFQWYRQITVRFLTNAGALLGQMVCAK